MKKHVNAILRLIRAAANQPNIFAQLLNHMPFRCNAAEYARKYVDQVSSISESVPPQQNPLWKYFQNHTEGLGIWKWEHYFEIYQRHFGKFVGRDVNVLEIGIYSGGSLEMWRTYFGERCHIYGVDIEDSCKAYENEYTSVLIGDQESRDFWRTFRKETAEIDILIDDGGHTANQQQVTLEEMLPYIRPGGVYLCEDVHERNNGFSNFASSLVDELNNTKRIPGANLQSEMSRFQRSIHSIHFYPYVIVIEKHETRPSRLSAPMHGTRWQPFL